MSGTENQLFARGRQMFRRMPDRWRMEKSFVTRGANWEHVHSNCACLLRLSLLHWFRFAGFHQCIKIQVKEGRISHEKRQLQEQKRHWRERIARMSCRHIVANTAQGTRFHVGDRTRTRESSKQNYLHEHVRRHHQLR